MFVPRVAERLPPTFTAPELKITPLLKSDLSALLTVDARPTQNLRMYTKFGFAYPFASSIGAYTKDGAKTEFQGFDSDMFVFVFVPLVLYE